MRSGANGLVPAEASPHRMAMLPCLRRPVCLAAAAVFIALLAGPAPARAQTDSAAARALFAEARTLMEKERFDEACPKFEESLRLDQGMGTQFNLAHCWEKIGRTASAWALFLDVAAAARAGDQPKREEAARARAKALEPKLTRLRIEVTDVAPGTQVQRDGQEVGKAAWGTGVPVDPGNHVVRVTAPGKKPWSDDIDVPAAPRTFTVTVPALTDAPMEVAEPEVTPVHSAPVEAGVDTRRDSGSNGQKVAAWVVGGIGVAAAATGTVFAIQSRSDNASAEKLCHVPTEVPGVETCGSDEEQERLTGHQNDARRNRLIGFIGIGAGGAALVTAVILYATAGEVRSERASLEIEPLWGSGVRGAAISGHF
jgi:hypothetical protein